MSIINNLRAIRKAHKMSQAEVAEILETTQQQYSKYENGTHEIPTRHIIALCKFYGITSDELLGINNEQADVNLNAIKAVEYIEQLHFTSYADFLKKSYQDGTYTRIKRDLGELQAYWLVCEKLGITPNAKIEIDLEETE